MTNRVREVVQQNIDEGTEQQDTSQLAQARHRAVRRKYMAWNAASAAQAEVIEYLEELIDLTKLLVGANEFRSGLLMRTTYYDYAKDGDGTKAKRADNPIDIDDETRDEVRAELTRTSGGIRNRRRATSTLSTGSTGKEEIPASLKRIQSRKIEAGIRRQATNERWSR